MIYLGYAVQACMVGGFLWAISPAPKPLEAFIVDRGKLVMA
ncbi:MULTISPECIES: hypothetical protein [unclassified Rhodococcus (in: high G+C Gram-positive bacteria)]|nr:MULTISPECIES: hypothetical protein [unclassified Rhodococcus (in: high G+C Gram-positive bacteria)]